jgi:acyl-CoA thioesterase
MREQYDHTEAIARARRILARDQFSSWAGMEIEEIADGLVVLALTVRPDMINGFGVCHGGITFSLADSALALAANTGDTVALALETNISFTAPAWPGDRLTVRLERQSHGARVNVYTAIVTNQKGKTVGLFRGTIYRTNKPLET